MACMRLFLVTSHGVAMRPRKHTESLEVCLLVGNM